MNAKKILSVAIAALLLCGCIVGMLFTGANAAGPLTLYVSGTVASTGNGLTPETPFLTVAEAMQLAKTKVEAGEITSLTIKVSGVTKAIDTTATMGEIFGAKTLFLNQATGKKLPITIQGATDDAQLEITPVVQIYCANDYTFKDIKIHRNHKRPELYAGSGNVTFENVVFSARAKNDSGVGWLISADSWTTAAFDGWNPDLTSGSKMVSTSITLDAVRGVINYAAASGIAGNGDYAVYEKTDEQANPAFAPEETKATLIVKNCLEDADNAWSVFGLYSKTQKSRIGEANVIVESGYVDSLRGTHGGSSCQVMYTSPVNITINGGKIRTFFPVHNTSTVTKPVHATITGGEFMADAKFYPEATLTKVEGNSSYDGKITVDVKPGANGITIKSDFFVDDTHGDQTTVNLYEGVYNLGTNGELTGRIGADSVNGNISLNQISGWIKNTVYLQVPASVDASKVSAYRVSGVAGSVNIKDVTIDKKGDFKQWVGAGADTGTTGKDVMPAPVVPNNPGNSGSTGGSTGSTGGSTGSTGGSTGSTGGSTGSSPSTGDNSNLVAMFAIATISLVGLVGTVVYRKRTSL